MYLELYDASGILVRGSTIERRGGGGIISRTCRVGICQDLGLCQLILSAVLPNLIKLTYIRETVLSLGEFDTLRRRCTTRISDT